MEKYFALVAFNQFLDRMPLCLDLGEIPPLKDGSLSLLSPLACLSQYGELGSLRWMTFEADSCAVDALSIPAQAFIKGGQCGPFFVNGPRVVRRVCHKLVNAC